MLDGSLPPTWLPDCDVKVLLNVLARGVVGLSLEGSIGASLSHPDPAVSWSDGVGGAAPQLSQSDISL